MVMYGGCLDPHACFLLNRGIQTLGLRVRKQCESALAVAQMLEKHPLVRPQPLPGLACHPSVPAMYGAHAPDVMKWDLVLWHQSATSVILHLERGGWSGMLARQ